MYSKYMSSPPIAIQNDATLHLLDILSDSDVKTYMDYNDPTTSSRTNTHVIALFVQNTYLKQNAEQVEIDFSKRFQEQYKQIVETQYFKIYEDAIKMGVISVEYPRIHKVTRFLRDEHDSIVEPEFTEVPLHIYVEQLVINGAKLDVKFNRMTPLLHAINCYPNVYVVNTLSTSVLTKEPLEYAFNKLLQWIESLETTIQDIQKESNSTRKDDYKTSSILKQDQIGKLIIIVMTLIKTNEKMVVDPTIIEKITEYIEHIKKYGEYFHELIELLGVFDIKIEASYNNKTKPLFVLKQSKRWGVFGGKTIRKRRKSNRKKSRKFSKRN